MEPTVTQKEDAHNCASTLQNQTQEFEAGSRETLGRGQ